MEIDPYDLRKIQLKGYLREFFVAPDMDDTVWETARFCMGHSSHGFFGFKFHSLLAMKQFAQACLLSCGRQLSWVSTGSYDAVQRNFDDSMVITDYVAFDVVFVHHMVGTMRNAIMGQTISQIGLGRGSKKTFFFDCGGYALSDLSCRVVTLREAAGVLNFGGSGPVVSKDRPGVRSTPAGEFDGL
jgi:hypothetical protein